MAAINWDESMSVSIESIDDQHKKLFDMINEFYDNINKRSTQALLSKLIAGMKSYTVYHFSTEEKYMKEYNFPGYSSHKREHDSFIEKVIELEGKINSGAFLVSFEVTNFLRNWVKNHIQHTDKKYSDFFLERGIT